MTDRRGVFGSRRPSRRPSAWTAGALGLTVAIGIAAAGCSGSQAAPVSPAAAASSALPVPSVGGPASAEPSSPAPGAMGSAPVASSAPAAGSAPVHATSPAAAGAGAGAGAANAVIHDCKQQSVTRPSQYTLACGDGTTSLNKLQWSNWGASTATATGVYETVVCSPSCAAGTEHSYPATVSLTGLSDGAYTKMAISAPQSSTPNVSYALGSSGPRFE